MGWNFRKSIKLGPARVNLSKSGVGISVGVKGIRVGKDSKGRSYTHATIPGTGLTKRDYTKSSNKKSSSKVFWIIIGVVIFLLWASLR